MDRKSWHWKVQKSKASDIKVKFVKFVNVKFYMKKAIFIDPGHGGADPGCPKGNGEKYYNLEIALRLADRLEQDGWIVGMSRTDDSYVSLKERCRIANEFYKNHGGIFLSIHHDAALNSSAHGMTPFYYRGSNKGWLLAKHITWAARTTTEVYCSNMRGERTAGFYVLKHTKAPAVLVECEFLTNPAKLEWIQENEEEWFEHMSEVLYKGMKSFYEVS